MHCFWQWYSTGPRKSLTHVKIQYKISCLTVVRFGLKCFPPWKVLFKLVEKLVPKLDYRCRHVLRFKLAYFLFEAKFLCQTIKIYLIISKICMFDTNLHIRDAIYDQSLKQILFFRPKKTFNREKHFSSNRTSVRQLLKLITVKCIKTCLWKKYLLKNRKLIA